MEPSTNYPSNSRLKKEEPKIPEITKVDLKGKASVRDKSMGERFTSLFDKRDFQDIFYHQNYEPLHPVFSVIRVLEDIVDPESGYSSLLPSFSLILAI